MAALAVWLPARAAGEARGGEQAEPAAGRAILNGYRRYHATCSHCHGPDGSGSSFGRSLIDAPLPWAEFEALTGNFVMRGFADDPNVVPTSPTSTPICRRGADGAIGRGRPTLKRSAVVPGGAPAQPADS